jgi:phosphoglycolate phosphatase-like HAD superfamily hydrolase
MIKVVIFDFDGVLAESVNIKTEAFAKLFEPEGSEAVRAIVAYHLTHGGLSRFEKFRYMYREVLKRPLSDAEFDDLCKQFEDLVLDGVISAPEVEGATKCLRELYGKVKLFIVSGTPQEEMRHIAKVRGIARYFEGIFGAPESKSALVGKVLAKAGSEPKETVLIGDAMTDYDAAEETGVGFIARRTAENGELWEKLKAETIDNMGDCARALGF